MATKNKTPLRQCAGCREMKSKKEMIRVLKTPENEICAGCYRQERTAEVPMSVCHRSVWKKQSKAVGSSAHSKMAVPAEVYEDLKKELANIEKQQIKCYHWLVLQQKRARLPAVNLSYEKNL